MSLVIAYQKGLHRAMRALGDRIKTRVLIEAVRRHHRAERPDMSACPPIWAYDAHGAHLLRWVRKKSGYEFPGVVVAQFMTLAGEKRVVVECTVPEVAGVLHIFNPDQIEDV
jgi:hypothetical protein